MKSEIQTVNDNTQTKWQTNKVAQLQRQKMRINGEYKFLPGCCDFIGFKSLFVEISVYVDVKTNGI